MKTITFDPAGGEWKDGSSRPVKEKADYDSFVAIKEAPSRDYYEFEWWEDSTGRQYVPGHDYKVRDDHEFKALWLPIDYGITYDLAGGTLGDKENPTFYNVETEEFTLAAPEREGYVFTGWTGSNGDKPEKELTVDTAKGGDRNYIANYDKLPPGADDGVSTGDGFAPVLWGGLMMAAAALMALLYAAGRRRKER